jgi:eukaryotic-like serine/threonine-protein kinase
MTIGNDELLLQVAEAIAEGRAVDWNELASRVDDATLQRLREISALAGQFGAAKGALESRFDAQSKVPQTWAHLQLIEEIGRGSSGVVYRAWDPMLQRAVALKLCNPDRDDGDGLLREAQLMARVDHAGVLKIHGAALHDGQVGFWSDLVDGDSISSRLEREGRLPMHEVVTLGLELCSALAAIHAHDLVHGDVKAQNVVRRSDGRHILVDFGSSTPIRERAQVSGTPLYLAPDLLMGGPAGPEHDLYSLGVLLFRMLSGKFPVEASSLVELADCHRRGVRRYLIDLAPDVSREISAVIERAIRADPATRFRTAGEFAAALRSSLQTTQPLPVAAGPAQASAAPVPASSARPWRKLRPWAAAACLLIAVAAIAWQWPQRESPAAGFQARLVRAVGGVEYPLLDGDRVAAGDSLSLDIELTRPGHVYVFNEDAAGAVFQLFPLAMAEQVNPLPARQRLRLPGRIAGRDVDWLITSPGARERFYVLVSPQEIGELALAATGFAQAELGRPVDRSALMAATRRVRGAGGLAERQDSGAQFDWKVGDWLAQLQSQHRGASLQKFELENPQ